jgi:hypothetical protein
MPNNCAAAAWSCGFLNFWFVLRDCGLNFNKDSHFLNAYLLVHLPNSYFEPGYHMDYLATSERIDHFQSDTKRGVFVVVSPALKMNKTVHLSHNIYTVSFDEKLSKRKAVRV